MSYDEHRTPDGETPGPHVASGPEQWLGAPDPVETFGQTIEQALRNLSIELAGLRAERDGMRLELEGLRTQLELTQQRLADRDHFTTTVRELTQIVQRLTLPPRWAGDPGPQVAPVAQPQPPYVPPVAPPVYVAPAPPPYVAPVAPEPVTAPEPPPVAYVAPEPVAAPEPPPVAYVAPEPAPPAALEPVAVPEPVLAPEPPAPEPVAATPVEPPPAPDPVTSTWAMPATGPVAPTPDPGQYSFGTESFHTLGEPSTTTSTSLLAPEERFFDQPGVWLGEPPDRRGALRSRLGGWGKKLGTGLLSLVVVIVLFISVGPKLLPYQTFFVRSGSMSPVFDTGDMIFLTKVDASDIKARDIITFERPDQPGTLVTHRVVAVETSDSGQKQFQTKGDANGQSDAWRVPATGDGWKYAFRAPKIGFVFGYLGTPQARLALLAIPAVLLGILSLIDIWKPSPKSRGRH